MTKKNLQYAAVIAAIAFAVMVIPCVICWGFRFNFVMVSLGITLGVVFLVKGKIAKKIYGSDQNHKSSVGLAWFFFTISLISLVIKISTHIQLMRFYKDMGYEYSNEISAENLLPIIFASSIWSVIIFACIFLRNFFRKNLKDDTNIVDMSHSMSLKDVEPRKSHEEQRKDDIHITENKETNNTRSKENKIKFLIKKYAGIPLYGWITVIVVLLGLICFYLASKRSHENDPVEKLTIGRYVYDNGCEIIHIDDQCPNLQFFKIPIDTLELMHFEKVCTECVNEVSCEHLKELCIRNKEVDSKRRWLYNRLQSYYNMDEYDVFIHKIKNPQNGRKIYNAGLENGLVLGSFEEFSEYMGIEDDVNDKVDFEDDVNDEVDFEESSLSYEGYNDVVNLKELYNTLKADGAPVPDTYERFYSYMTSGPNGGYTHRKQVYDALKADGVPLPDTYEEFAKRLGLVATSSYMPNSEF